ncbi:DNA polymerase IV [Paenibacillus sp. J31TS4]|uniref:DNA polymerase IV n=1 Tax=Paenibacillus sp. J31TS4 TaxID=2807195 RepID=UPI0020BF3B24|nr:DNA polymerase IV [Paenibacillus sp. J31TS4]
MQSFYASVEKASYPEYKNRPLVVAGDPERRSGIVLAACPLAKQHGVSTAQRLGDALNRCPGLVVVRPHMQRYIDVSIQITEILERYSDQVEPYSIDEQFVDVTGSLGLFGEPLALAKAMQRSINLETGVYARVGIGPNKVLAKMACDNLAKKNKEGIFHVTRETMPEALWPLPVGSMFGAGRRMTAHFQRMGIHTIGELARFPLARLQQLWGVNGHVLWMTANGIDHSPVSPGTHGTQKAIGHNMTLPRDYRTMEEIRVVLLELSEEVGRRARYKGLMGTTVSAGCRGADFDRPSGFSRQMKLEDPTHSAKDIYRAACRLFDVHWDGQPVRSLGVNLDQLRPDHQYQLDLFRNRDKERRLDAAIDGIKERYGAAAIVKAASLSEAGQAFYRATRIGGHAK